MKVVVPTLEDDIEIVDNASALFIKMGSLNNVETAECDVSGQKIKSAEIDACRLQKVDFTETSLEKILIKDTIVEKGSLAACNFTESGWRYVVIADARCSGTLFQMSKLKDVTFRNCKMDLVNFRYTKLENVIFESCLLEDSDFYGAELTNVVFESCNIEKIEFSSAKLKNVDLSSSDIDIVQGLTSMRGATVSSLQLIHLAPYMAQELGLLVKHEDR